MRLIDADALYKQMTELEELARNRVLDTESVFPYPNNLNPSYTRYLAQMDELTKLKELVTDAPTIEPEQRWIPAWQEYPQDNRFVLVCNDDGRCAVAQYIGHEVDAYHPWQIAYCPYDVDIWDDEEHGKIVAWMDLPKPYKEDGDDEGRSTSTFERLRSRILRR